MKLSTLMNLITQGRLRRGGAEEADPDIGSLHYRSQDVLPGGLFVAVRGFKTDGHDFIPQAIDRGAAVIISQKQVACDVAVVVVPDTREALSEIAHHFYGKPSEHLCVVAVTGTNGKTTTAFLIENILQQAGCAAGLISTIHYRYAGKTHDSAMTTPESADIHRILADMRSAGVTHVVMEASSHAIDLHRLNHCRLDVAVFTNLTQDHLDYHGSMDTYWACKKRLFTELLQTAPKAARSSAVINTDTEKGRELMDQLNRSDSPPRRIHVGRNASAPVRPVDCRCDLQGISGSIAIPEGEFDFHSPLVGDYNLENILCATGAGVALGLSMAAIRRGIESFQRVPGRLERIDSPDGRHVFVDYAHTPDALENVLKTLRAVTRGRLIVVFGCGGDRDPGKRPLMGGIAAGHADLSVVTSDNPRTEAPETIIEQILEGIRPLGVGRVQPETLKNGFSGKAYLVESDRRKAIGLGIGLCRPGDTVLIAGKGHEPYQIVGSRTLPFDDRVEARRVVEDGYHG